MTPAAHHHPSKLAAREGLIYKDKHSFVLMCGMRGGFPVLYQFPARGEGLAVVIYARLAPGSPTMLPRTFAPPLDALVRAALAQSSVRDQFAVLKLEDCNARLRKEDLMPATDAFLAGLRAAGVHPQAACGWCGSTEKLSVQSGYQRVGLVCAACLAKREKVFQEKYGYLPSSLPKLIALGAVALVGIALLWAGLNIWADRAVRAIGEPTKFHLVALLLGTVAMGLVVGLPAGLLDLVPRRGVWASLTVALMAGLLAILVGEAMHIGWLLHQRGDGAWVPTLRQFVDEAFSGNWFYCLARALLALATLTYAVLFSVPRRHEIVP